MRTLFMLGAIIMTGYMSSPAGAALPEASADHLPRWRGFNLLEMFMKSGDKLTPFHEEDFQWIHEWGFNFVRLPMDYRWWIADGDWTKFNEAALAQIDQAVKWGERYDVHVMINFHRAPGYTVANPPEKLSVWKDDEALRVCAMHWAMFARRYRGVPNRQLSFNLFNEPNDQVSPADYARVAKVLCEAIRAEDPQRLIVCDGLNWGNEPVKELASLHVAQATRGYQPFGVTHYKASWAGKWDDVPEPIWPIPSVNQMLYAPGGDKAKWHRPLVIEGAMDRAMALRVRVHQVSGDGVMVVKADDVEIFRHAFAPGPGEGEWSRVVYEKQWRVYQNIYDRDYAATIPAGTKRVTIELAEGDWMRLSELGLSMGEKQVAVLPLRDGQWGSPEAEPIRYVEGRLAAGRMTDGESLRRDHVEPWVKFAGEQHVGVMVSEFGAYNKTGHEVTLRWMEDCLSNWKRAGFGWALWNFRGSFGVLDSDRADVQYENFRGRKLDRAMLELLRKY